ncbi:MAG: SAM-dependent methyltransferase, partial [Stackebrandtia sp.]
IMEFLVKLRTRLAPGSCLAISHASDRIDADVKAAFAEEMAAGRYPKAWFRSDDEISAFFEGYDLVEPGVVDYRDWRPSRQQADDRPDLKTMMSSAVGVLRSRD